LVRKNLLKPLNRLTPRQYCTIAWRISSLSPAIMDIDHREREPLTQRGLFSLVTRNSFSKDNLAVTLFNGRICIQIFLYVIEKKKFSLGNRGEGLNRLTGIYN
jgi:hypothetical protein